ncbi:hypothetical protein F7725_006331 [Dissostichus mawsoni]|uniref:Uncharacterized protein n=1 Tax=Dissostichus mawsoni TaxID=36200 RepID=A0A7J5XVG1_DISMA|nr:hypothetical protein F7725_006331 [Dissostichus mawsoni]
MNKARPNPAPMAGGPADGGPDPRGARSPGTERERQCLLGGGGRRGRGQRRRGRSQRGGVQAGDALLQKKHSRGRQQSVTVDQRPYGVHSWSEKSGTCWSEKSGTSWSSEPNSNGKTGKSERQRKTRVSSPCRPSASSSSCNQSAMLSLEFRVLKDPRPGGQRRVWRDKRPLLHGVLGVGGVQVINQVINQVIGGGVPQVQRSPPQTHLHVPGAPAVLPVLVGGRGSRSSVPTATLLLDTLRMQRSKMDGLQTDSFINILKY